MVDEEEEVNRTIVLKRDLLRKAVTILAVVATIANATTLLYFLNWNGWGISPQAWAVIMLIAALGIASAVSLTRGNVAYMLVIVWAFAGIGVTQADTPLVASTAWLTVVLAGLMLVVGVYSSKAGARRLCLPENRMEPLPSPPAIVIGL
jgi:hypothetical protein